MLIPIVALLYLFVIYILLTVANKKIKYRVNPVQNSR